MNTTRLKSNLNKKISFALLSGALALQSASLIKRWANSPEHSVNSILDEHGNTALHIAVQNSWPEAAEILISKGESAKNTNDDNLNALVLARNIYREYENKVILANIHSYLFPLDKDTALRFVKAKQVLDILDKYAYADNI